MHPFCFSNLQLQRCQLKCDMIPSHRCCCCSGWFFLFFCSQHAKINHPWDLFLNKWKQAPTDQRKHVQYLPIGTLGYMCMLVHVHLCAIHTCVCKGAVFVCGRQKCPRVLQPPPQTRLLLTSVSQLADWRENIPAPSLPHPPFLSIPPFLHQTIPSSQSASRLGSAA